MREFLNICRVMSAITLVVLMAHNSKDRPDTENIILVCTAALIFFSVETKPEKK
jgi:hypothetical protein